MHSTMMKWISLAFMLGLPGILTASIASTATSASMCDVKVFPDCNCNDNQTSIFCRISNESISKTMTFSGDNVPATVERIIIISPYDSVNSSVVVQEAHTNPLRLEHLSFVGLDKLEIAATLNRVNCLYVLLNRAQQFAAGSLTPEIDVTYVYDYDMYPGLSISPKASRNIIEFLFKSCELRKTLKEIDSSKCPVHSIV